MRINLFESLTSSYSFYETNLTNSNNVLNNQIVALKIANEQLNTLKKRMKLVMDKNANKRRLIQINTYYGKQYDAYSQVMKYIFIVTLILLVLTVFANKEWIPRNIYTFLVILILFIGFIYIISKVWDIYLRDNMNFDEYNWNFSPSFSSSTLSSLSSSTSSSSTSSSSVQNSLTCVGSACCSSSELFDESQNLCVPTPSNS
jgi:hypothetical protein